MPRLHTSPLIIAAALSGCVSGGMTSLAGATGGVVMAYEVSGRVSNDENACGSPVSDVSVAMFDPSGVLLDETRTDPQGHFVVGVKNPDAAEGLSQRLDSDDPTMLVALRVTPPGRAEMRYQIRLPRPIAAKEYRVRLNKKKECDD